jgi:hypothetical protein
MPLGQTRQSSGLQRSRGDDKKPNAHLNLGDVASTNDGEFRRSIGVCEAADVAGLPAYESFWRDKLFWRDNVEG